MRQTFYRPRKGVDSQRDATYFYKMADTLRKHPYTRKNCATCGKSQMMKSQASAQFCSKACSKMGDLNPSKQKATNHGLNKTQYAAVHTAVRASRGSASKCMNGCAANVYHWANISGDYYNVNDYQEMCPTCHDRLDRYKSRQK